MAEWIGRSELFLDLEGHGREAIAEGIDLSRSVGWFTSILPVHLRVTTEGGINRAVRTVRDQLRRIPRKGIGYGALRYLSADAGVQRQLTGFTPEVCFNYLGQFDQLFDSRASIFLGCEKSGLSQSHATGRAYILEVVCQVLNGRLTSRWTYSRNLHRRQTIELLAERFVAALRNYLKTKSTYYMLLL
jgi:non-ribosomal peptide synthase protein (TIGR01720 family)